MHIDCRVFDDTLQHLCSLSICRESADLDSRVVGNETTVDKGAHGRFRLIWSCVDYSSWEEGGSC